MKQYRETKATRAEAWKAAFRDVLLMVIPACIAAPFLLWFMLYLSLPSNQAAEAWGTMWFVSLFMMFYLGIPILFLTYLRVRGEPTRAEVEERDRERRARTEQRERAEAAALLAKYPDLKDS